MGRRESEAVKDRRYQVVCTCLGTAPGRTPKTRTMLTRRRVPGSIANSGAKNCSEPYASRAGRGNNTSGNATSWSLCGRSARANGPGRAGPAVWAKNCSSGASSLPICQKNCSERSCRSGLRSGTNVIHTINKLGRCFLLERLPLREQQLPRPLESRLRRASSERPHDVVRRGDSTRRPQGTPRRKG